MQASASPEGDLIATGHYGGFIQLWDQNKRTVIGIINTGVPGPISAIAISPNQHLILVATDQEPLEEFWYRDKANIVKLLDRNKNVIQQWEGPRFCLNELSSDNNAIITIYHNGTICTREIGQDATVEFLIPKYIQCAGISNDQGFIVVGTSEDVGILDRKTKAFQQWNSRAFIRAVAIAPDNSFVVTGHHNGRVAIWKIDGALIQEWYVKQPVNVVMISPTNSFIATQHSDNSAYLYQPVAPQQQQSSFTERFLGRLKSWSK